MFFSDPRLLGLALLRKRAFSLWSLIGLIELPKFSGNVRLEPRLSLVLLNLLEIFNSLFLRSLHALCPKLSRSHPVEWVVLDQLLRLRPVTLLGLVQKVIHVQD